MEFTIRRDYFINQLNDTLKAISPRTTLPIIKSKKIEVKNNEVILTGSDSEISIEITIPKQVDGEDIIEITETGSVVLPGRFFVDIIKKLPGKEVKLSTNEQFQTLITSGHSEFNLSGLKYIFTTYILKDIIFLINKRGIILWKVEWKL